MKMNPETQKTLDFRAAKIDYASFTVGVGAIVGEFVFPFEFKVDSYFFFMAF